MTWPCPSRPHALASTASVLQAVELLAAMIMLIGAAMGAQLGATATIYARGTIIRLYFAISETLESFVALMWG